MSYKPRDMTEFPPHPDDLNRGAAVECWNSEGRRHGPRSQQVRDFMQNEHNC